MLRSVIASKPRKNVFAVVDLGTTKALCCIVRVSGGVPKVIGMGYRESHGINCGAIVNLSKAGSSILESVDAAEKMSSETVDSVYVCISGPSVVSKFFENSISTNEHEISDKDVKRLLNQTYEKIRAGNIIVHNIPMSYTLDDHENIVDDPIGLYGAHLKAKIHAVVASKSVLMNLEHCLNGCNFNMAGCIAASYASGLSCLTQDEKELGAIVIDIGGGYTSIAVWSGKKFVYGSGFSLGGDNITRDIASGLGISLIEAERIKSKYGSAVYTDNNNRSFEVIKKTAFSEELELERVKMSTLVSIIRPRVEEMLEFIEQKIADIKIRRVVITGGSSMLGDLREIAEHILHRQVRLGVPFHLDGMPDEYLRNPRFSVMIGMVRLITKEFFSRESETSDINSGLFEKISRAIFG